MFLRSTWPRPATRRGRGVQLAAGAVALGLLAAGCSSGSSSSASGSGSSGGGGGVTLVAYTGQAGDYQVNFNPYAPSSIGGKSTIYETLFFINKAKAGDPVPLLGTKYAWNAAGTQLTVTLRSGVTWSDGQPFTAKDVAFTYNLLVKNPAINNQGFTGTATATDDTTATFTFAAPSFVTAPDILSGIYILPEHLWKDRDPTKDVDAHPVGTGAYTLGSFKAQAFTYIANPKYWGGEPKVKTIRFLSLSGNTAGADGIAGGTIDWQTGPVPDIAKVHQNFPKYDTLTASQNQMVMATCSSAALGCTGPQTDPAVRHALFLALDRTQLNALAFENTASDISPTLALASNQSSWITSSITPAVASRTPDVAGAQAALTAAGYVKGSDGYFAKGGKKLTLTIEVVTGWTDYITALQTMAQQLKATGIDLQISQSSWNEWTEKKTQGKFQLVMDSLYQGPAPDPYYLYTYFYASTTGAAVGKTAGTNYARYSNPVVDTALTTLKTLPLNDKAARQPLFDTIEKAVVTDMPYVPVLTGGTTSEWNTAKFSGWPTADNLYAFPAVWSAADAAEIFKRLTPTGK